MSLKSWLTSIIPPSNSLMASASASMVSMSRWLVGSSRKSMWGFCQASQAKHTRHFCPSERFLMGLTCPTHTWLAALQWPDSLPPWPKPLRSHLGLPAAPWHRTSAQSPTLTFSHPGKKGIPGASEGLYTARPILCQRCVRTVNWSAWDSLTQHSNYCQLLQWQMGKTNVKINNELQWCGQLSHTGCVMYRSMSCLDLEHHWWAHSLVWTKSETAENLLALLPSIHLRNKREPK